MTEVFGQYVALLAGACAFGAAAWGMATQRDVLYPPVVVGSVWGGTLVVYALLGERLPELEIATGVMLASGPWLFALGSAGGAREREEDETRPWPIASRAVGDLLLAVALVGLPVMGKKLLEIGSTGPTSDFFVNLRLAQGEEGGENSLGVLAYLGNFSIFGAAMHALHFVETTRTRIVAATTVAVLYCLAGTGRTFFVLLLLLLGGGLAVSGRIHVRVFMAWFVGIFVVVFLGVGVVVGKINDEGSAIVASTWAQLSAYLVGGSAALDDFLKSSEPLKWGENTGRTVVAILHRLGVTEQPATLVKEFRDVGIVTNVYTVHRPYFEDFGWIGVIVIQLTMGYLSGLSFARARSGSKPAAYAYGLILYPNVMQVFQDQYFSLASTWMQAALMLLFVGAAARIGSGRDLECETEDAPDPRVS